MQRRHFIAAGSAFLSAGSAFGHHGWSSFDQDKPLFVEGEATSVTWRNPHVELRLRVAPDLRLPADLARRNWPSQSAGVDAARIVAAARVPSRKVGEWEIELAPLSRVQAWKIDEIKPGQRVGVIGYTFAGERGDAVIRAEYLLVGDQAYGLRSSPV